MNQHEICRHIVKHGICVNISCSGERESLNKGTPCPMHRGKYDCNLAEGFSFMAQKWLFEHEETSDVVKGRVYTQLDAKEAPFDAVGWTGNTKEELFDNIVNKTARAMFHIDNDAERPFMLDYDSHHKALFCAKDTKCLGK